MQNFELRLPPELRKSLKSAYDKREVMRILREGNLSTVCEEARCPNIGECFSNKTATFMIMGDRCTRRCHFCSVSTKKPLKLNIDEPLEVAIAAQKMGLDYIVITSVDRDELPDLGASHFVAVIKAIKERIPHAKIEVLTPDFKARTHCLDLVLKSPLDIFGHNIETVPRLYKKIRPQSDFFITKSVLSYASKKSSITTKTGMMLGLGETDHEVYENLSLIRDLGVKIVTIGQYLRPSRKHWPVSRYVDPETFHSFSEFGKKIGLGVLAGAFVRSSYHAKETSALF